MTAYEVVFVLLGVLTLGAAVLVVSSRQLVHAALWLVVALGGLAGCYLVLTAELVAVVQLLIYLGAVVVLLLFAVMVTRTSIGPVEDLDTGNRPAAVLVALTAAGLLIALLVDAFDRAFVDLSTVEPGSAAALGAAIFRTWVLPFEVISVLLLAALVGAVVLSRRDVGSPGRR
ncbi:MAG TPA: NADH-quinone oxidoreductase subunit J [Mycobacteriales bacterium]|nr:NADH-quinone oxidoreductase subunit J [Mycobacteriales bacterium]